MLREYLSNIADKFRTYLDTTEPINAQDFAGKVEDVAVRYNQLGFTNGYNLGLEEGKPLGKLELLQDSEYMNAKVSGTAIAVNDVNAVEHSVGCYLTSDTIADFGGIEVSRYGKNLFDKSNYVVDGGVIGFDISSLEIGKTYTFSSSIPIAFFKISSSGGGYNSVLNATNDLFNTFTFVMAKHENISPTSKQYIFICKERIEGPFVGNISELDGYDFQLEGGTTATPYEPFTKQTYQSTADGTVEGVTSISPNMTLLTNNNGVVINANYLRDIDTYIDNLKTNVALTGGE